MKHGMPNNLENHSYQLLPYKLHFLQEGKTQQVPAVSFTEGISSFAQDSFCWGPEF